MHGVGFFPRVFLAWSIMLLASPATAQSLENGVAATPAAEPALPANEPAPEAAPVIPAAEPAPPPATGPAPEAAPVPRRTTVFIMDIRAKGAGAPFAEGLTLAVEQAFQGRDGYDVLSAEDLARATNAMAEKASVGCSDDQCAAELSRFLNADLLVTGELGTVGKALSLTLSLMRSKTSAVENRVALAGADWKELLAGIPAAVGSLMKWTTETGAARFSLPEGRTVSLAVLDLSGKGVSEDTAAQLTQVLSAELKRIEGTSVVSRTDIVAMMQVQEQKMLAGCDDASCLAEIGGALGVEHLVAGSVGKVGQAFVISLRLISVKSARVEHRVFDSFSGDEEQLIRAFRNAGRRILGLEPRPGTLTVSVDQQGAELFLDGKLLGLTPMAPVPGIAEGSHTLHVTKAGFQDHHADVYVEFGEANPVWVPLAAIPVRPWYQRPWLMTSIIVPAVVGPPAAALLVALVGTVAAGIVYALVVRDGVTRTSLGNVEL